MSEKYEDSTLLSVCCVVLYIAPPTFKTTVTSVIAWSSPLDEGGRVCDRDVPLLYLPDVFAVIRPLELPLHAAVCVECNDWVSLTLSS